ncbi:MAG: MgtC/SapB family protein [bacterium]
MRTFFGTAELIFIVNLALSIGLGAFIGLERELRNKDAGISTSVFIVAGAMLFTYISTIIGVNDSARVAAQIVSGIGFIGAGLIIRDGSNIKNLTTAAGVWFMAAVGMAIGFQLYFIAIVGAAAAAFIPRIPYYRTVHAVDGEEEHEKK